MKIHVDGGCRHNGRADAFGAAAAIIKLKWGRQKSWVQALPSWPRPTSQRAELTAIILALNKALERYQNLIMNPKLRLTIYSDSDYAVKCMNVYVQKWSQNGWRTASGTEVKNQDLIQRALYLVNQLKQKGTVKFAHVPREMNQEADSLCNMQLNEMSQSRSSYDMDDLDDRFAVFSLA